MQKLAKPILFIEPNCESGNQSLKLEFNPPFLQLVSLPAMDFESSVQNADF